jgi:predicted outer membrane repeat protein
MRKHVLVSSLLFGTCLLLTQLATAATFIVNNTQDVPDAFPGNGSCTPIGGVGDTCTLRAAVMEANAQGGSHTILLASGTYVLTRSGIGEDAALDGDLDITADIHIVNGTNNPPVVFGSHGDRIFDVRSGATLSLTNVNVAGGYANDVGNVHGGAFRVVPGATLNLDRVVVSGNIANIGGAIYSDGAVTIVDSEFFGNAVTDAHTLLQFVNGAAILSRGTLSIERSSFHSNGLIPGADGFNFITTSYAIHARDGGPANPSLSIVNTTIAENATNGLQSERVPLNLQMSTIANNGQRGLRFMPDIGNLASNQLTIARSVVANHGGTDCNGLAPDTWNDLTNRWNASSDSSCGFSGSSDHQNIPYPFFGPLATYGGRTPVLMPRPESALVDGGSLVCSPSCVDQRGKPRPVDGNLDGNVRSDIGAVEYDPDSDPIPDPKIFRDGFETELP